MPQADVVGDVCSAFIGLAFCLRLHKMPQDFSFEEQRTVQTLVTNTTVAILDTIQGNRSGDIEMSPQDLVRFQELCAEAVLHILKEGPGPC